MLNKIEIRLTVANNEPVSLKSLSPDALDSFMTVVSSLKAIAVSVNSENLKFSFREGSAICAIEAPRETMSSIYQEMDLAIKGKSEDKEVTFQLRRIQDQLQRISYNYSFIYKEPGHVRIDIYNRLIQCGRITVKRSRKPFVHKLKILYGFLNQIGGKDPNYHFDYGHGDKITITCSQEEAIRINKYLYQNVNSLVVCKEWTDPERNNEYLHKLILQDKEARLFKSFIKEYYKEADLINKLTLIHDFVDNQFKKSNDSHEVLKCLLIGFNDKNFHLSEIKTLLVISKPFAEHEVIKQARIELFETYKLMRN